MLSLAQRLIDEERRAAPSPELKSRAAFTVCEKLRAPLATLAGVAGFRSLLSRALVLARAEAPLLGGVTVQLDGTFQYGSGFEAQMDTTEVAAAAAVLVEQLLGLLNVFYWRSVNAAPRARSLAEGGDQGFEISREIV